MTTENTSQNDRTGKAHGKALRNGAAVVMVTLGATSFFRAVAATATLPIVAKVVHAIEVTINTSMNFGTIALTQDVAATARLDPLTSNLRIDAESGLSSAGGTPRAGGLRIRGASLPVRVSMAENSVRITNGTTYLTISDFNFNTESGGHQITVTPTGPDNTLLLTVGASINTRARQMTGEYVGSSVIFANYQ